MEELHSFDNVYISDSNESYLPEFKGDFRNSNELLDYMVLVFSRCFQGEIAFKGGYLLNKILQDHSRLTHDVDFSIAKQSSYEEVKTLLRKVSSAFIDMGLIDAFRIKEEITVSTSGGVNLYSHGVKVLGVDVGLHDISYGITKYDFGFVTEFGFTVERMLADKIIAILSRKRFRRTKDLFDFYVLITTFDIKYNLLQKCLDNRGTAEWDNIPFTEEVLNDYEKAWDKLTVISSITRTQLIKPSFWEAIGLFDTIAFPLKNRAAFNEWNHVFKSWG